VLAKLGPDVPLHFTAFHPDFKLRDKPRTPPETLHEARRIAREVGLHYVYEGNIYSDGANTICPNCGELLVRRSWHDVLQNRVKDGGCGHCGFAIAGVWNNDPNRERARTREVGTSSRRYTHLNL
jgi:pyruvate formate lyase activating enzyme